MLFFISTFPLANDPSQLRVSLNLPNPPYWAIDVSAQNMDNHVILDKKPFPCIGLPKNMRGGFPN
jgi:hypothetical protein